MKKKFFAVFLIFFFLSLLSLLFLRIEVLAGYCGLYGCEADEDCNSCPLDCGDCPPPPPPPGPSPSPGASPPPNGKWELCGKHTCPCWPACTDRVEYECYPNCINPQYCQDRQPCPGDVPPGEVCIYDSDCFPNNCFCPGGVPCEMHCINGYCISDCGPSDGNGGGPSGSITCNPREVYVCDPNRGSTNVSWSTQNMITAQVWRCRVPPLSGCNFVNEVLWRTGVSNPGVNWNEVRAGYVDTFRLYAYDTHGIHLDSCQVWGICSDCDAICPSNFTMGPGDTQWFVAQVTNLKGEVRRVNFAIVEGDSSVITIDPTFDDTPPTWRTRVTAVSTGTRNVIARVRVDPGDILGCSCRTTINVRTPTWFQTQEGDVHAQGSISSDIPSAGIYFNLVGDGGTPGVVSHKDPLGSDPWGEGEVSETGWLANTSFSSKGYDYFYQLLGSPETENWDDGNIVNFPADPGTGETEIIYTTSPAHLPGFSNLSGRKIIVLTSSNAIIENNITITDGFLAVIASGQINIDDLVSEVHGVYIADGHISTGEGSLVFTGEGMFIANSFSLGRDLGAGNNTEAAVKFIYRPDLWLNAPAELLVPSYTWQELAP